ncbi:MAG: chemotaxis response regulator protein-glutamate methylesterase [Nitrospiraceae bacterium]|nr:chemotaxis response regulator protein-glutamate methylesterase [Nitrospiraceae bacterium]
MNLRAVKVLIVDDSSFMRKALSAMLGSDPDIEVVGTAADGREGVEKAEALKPDIITMDVEMPGMDGIEALKKIMRDNPLPVVMISAQTVEGARVTLRALELGAVDFISKNLSGSSMDIVRIRAALKEKIKHLGRKGFVRTSPERGGQAPDVNVALRRALKVCTDGMRVEMVAIGASTGGPKILQQIIPALPKNFPVPVLISQHMPPNFTKPFAERLDQISGISVKEAEDGETVKGGIVYIAPGRGHMRVAGGMPRPSVSVGEGGDFIYRPSVDVLMSSVAAYFPKRAVGVILTGMGHDGLKGLTGLKNAGGRVIAQDEGTCVIYGMPKAVVDAGLADSVLPAQDITAAIVACVCK